MRTWGVLLSAVVLGLAPGLQGGFQFTSKDGQRSFQAELMAYEEGTQLVTVRMKDGRAIKFNIDVLSEEGQEFVLSQRESLQIRNQVKVRVRPESGERNKVESRGLTCLETKEGFQVSLTNSGSSELKDVKVHYWIHWTDDEGAEGKTAKVEEGTEVLASVPPGNRPITFATPMISLVQRTPETVKSGPS